MESTRDNVNQAGIQLELAKMDLESAKEDLDDYILYAPYDGIVISSDFEVGKQAAGSAMISLISDEFIVKITVSENDISKISKGDEALITLDAYSDLEFNGSVIKKIPVSTNVNGIISFEVLIEFETEEDIDIYYGLSANASIITRKAENVLYVPIQSVYKEDGKSYVDLLISDQVDQENLSQAIEKAEVTTGINDYSYIEITSGLKEGDIIVTSRIQ
jgi:HlyD family secretion protein